MEERFWSKVNKTEGCWLWTASVNMNGYGKFGIGGKRGGWKSAHRVSYELVKGDIPNGLLLRHTCDNPPCVNPDHLIPGTCKENTQDMMVRGRNKYITHPLPGEKNPMSKLTDIQRSEIIDAVLNGQARKELAIKYKVCRQTIDNLMK